MGKEAGTYEDHRPRDGLWLAQGLGLWLAQFLEKQLAVWYPKHDSRVAHVPSVKVCVL